MFGWLRKKRQYTPTGEERQIIAAICNFGTTCRDAYELAPEPVRFEEASGIIVASLMNRPAGCHGFYPMKSGYGVTLREALLSLLATVNAKAVEQFQQQSGTDAADTSRKPNAENQAVQSRDHAEQPA